MYSLRASLSQRTHSQQQYDHERVCVLCVPHVTLCLRSADDDGDGDEYFNGSEAPSWARSQNNCAIYRVWQQFVGRFGKKWLINSYGWVERFWLSHKLHLLEIFALFGLRTKRDISSSYYWHFWFHSLFCRRNKSFRWHSVYVTFSVKLIHCLHDNVTRLRILQLTN